MSTPAPPTVRPFADSVLAYAQAGWPCILPVPPAKSPPPTGYTGADGRDTEPLLLATWAGTHADYSVALRMPDGVIGIDVDSYDKAGVHKHGAETHAAAVARWGELPATWSSTARGDGPSRISFYRAPAQRYATKLPGGDVEIIQRHHRYAVVWPSPHADAGDIYRWYDPTGAVADAPPKPDELAELPQAWIDGLLEDATLAGPTAAGRDAGQAMLAAMITDTRPACAELTSAVMTAVSELTAVDEGSRHDTAIARVHHLVMLAASGHPGLPGALPDLLELWDTLTAGEARGEEFDRMLLTSARKAVTAVGALPVPSDPCLVMGGMEVATPGGPAFVDDRPGSDAPDPIQPPRELHPQEVVGAAPFDPRAHLDQRLADAVLERMYPVLRFGYDVGGWLLRERVLWDQRADLAEWAIAQVAEMMPKGNPDAEKGSNAKNQAERRKRLMSAAGAGGVAKKMRARVAGGAHPCALRVAELDSEPWLLWAGGVGWDLSTSIDEPTRAQIDPATPHLRSAGVVPEVKPTPLWDAFTAAVWPDPELRAWALRVLSIAATGYADRALPILVGEGGRGKTQMIALIMSVLGNYAHAADPRLLNGLDNAHASIIYALKGRRLSFIDEGPREGRLGQERLKQLTGGGDLTGNQMNRNPITFTPTHTLVLTANEDPVLTDPAIRSRVRLIECTGDPDEVRAARRAIGHTSSAAWRREAPGVLAAMMREAAAWLANPDSGLTSAAPERYQQRVEELLLEQDPVRTWVSEETEAHPDGERSRALYEAFVGWSKNGNAHPSRIVSETKWGRELNRLGHPLEKRRDANYRPLRLKPRAGWIGGGFAPESGGLVDGLSSNPPTAETPANAGIDTSELISSGGLEGQTLSYTHAQAHAHAHAHTRGEVQNDPPPSIPPQPSPSPVTPSPTKRRRSKIDPAERAAAKAVEKAARLRVAIADAAGELIELPAVVTRDGTVSPIPLEQVDELAAAFGMLAELTVDVETSGYPIGHADHALRTIQLGDHRAALVFDADDRAQRDQAARMLRDAAVLHAHSATADLVPIDAVGALAAEPAWERMHDTVIPAKLADPRSTGSDPGLKQLAGTVLGANATAPGADAARSALFKAGKWLTDVDVTTPVERSGWAQVDRRCEVMVRYAASDVLDTAALARALPAVPPALLERERTAQRMTARVAHRGLAIDGGHVEQLLEVHRAERTAASQTVRAFGIDNPGSNPQVGTRLLELGAQLPMTPTGKPSVAKGVLERLRVATGDVGALVDSVLTYRHHDTALGTFLEPYHQLVVRGDGRARPTIYTLAADTGRMSCVRPNLQQVPREGGFRACITADPGTLLVSADFAGVELRVAAALSGDSNLRRMLAEGIDVHWEVARLAFGPDATKADRYAVKRGVFGRIYGGGISTIADHVGVSETTASAIVDALDTMTPELTAWSRSIREAVKAGHTQFPSYAGRTIHLPQAFPHKGPNYCIQGTARELLVDTLMRWRDTRWGNATLLPVHDELVMVIPEDEAADATAALVAAMETDLLGVRIAAEASEPSFSWKDAA